MTTNHAAARNAVLPSRPPPPPAAPRLPLSGSEELFSDVTYGSPRGKGNNNCYGWAIGDYRNSGGRKLQPGNLSGARGGMSLDTCAAVVARAAADLRAGGRGYTLASADAPCREGYYKVMSFLAKGADYHWYKQHRDALVRWPRGVTSAAQLAARLGVDPAQVYTPSATPRPGDVALIKDARLWSHKQGFATGPLLRDACDRAIRDPRRACRAYGGGLDYREFCGAMCVRNPATTASAPGAGRRRVQDQQNATHSSRGSRTRSRASRGGVQLRPHSLAPQAQGRASGNHEAPARQPT
jgi:hypothetical protein